MRKVKYVINSPVLQVTTDPFDSMELAEAALEVIIDEGAEMLPFLEREDIYDLFQIEGRSYIDTQS